MRRFWIAILLVAVLLLGACGGPTQPAEESATTAPEETEAPAEETEEAETVNISVAGSTTVQPLAELFAEAYMDMHDNVKVDVQGGGSSVGVKSAGQETVDVGMASREVKDSELEEFAELQVFPIAYDGIAVAVHPDVPVDDISLADAQAVFAGEITNWSELGGPDANITVVSREEGSGTRAAFEDMVMGEEKVIVDTAILQPSNGSVRTTVASTPESIGYLSFGYLDDTTKSLKVEGVAPTAANAANGSYPVVRPLNMMTSGKPGGAVQDWLDFILSAEGQAIVADEGYIPVTDSGEGEAGEAEEEAGFSGEISVAGSTTVQPLAELFAEAFMAMHPDVTIDVQGGGSSVGVKSAGQDTVDVGMASREVKDSELEEFAELQVFPIAYDGIAVAVHPDVPVDDISLADAQAVFAGEITNWSALGGPDANIIVVSREEGSGTRAAFEDMVMGEALIVDTAILQPSNGSVRTTVASTPESMGYLSFGYLDDTTKALSVDGVAPTAANAANGSYPVVRPLNMMTNGASSDLVQAWFDFILSAEGQAIVADEGYIAISDEEETAMDLSGEISVAGSTTVQPLAELFAEAFMAMHPDVTIDVQGGGSSVGVKSAGQDTVDVGMASREVKDSELEEFAELQVFPIAYDGIAVAVHPDVPVDDISLADAQAVFAGEITNWSALGGPDANIIVVSREEGSGTRAAFEDMVMGEALIVDTAILQPSNGSVRTTVASTPESMGYLSFGYLDDTTKALSVDGVAPTAANAANGSYPVVRPLNMMTNGASSDLVQAWFDFILSAEGQAIVADEGYIALE